VGTERINRYAPILRRVVEKGLWGDSPLFLLDVGASGGIEPHWRVFGDRLRAIGFEPLISEVDRLNRAAEGTDVRYEAAFVTCRDYDALFPPDLRNDRVRSRSNDAFARTSATRAQELLNMNYVEQVFNAGTPITYSDLFVVLDEFIPRDEYGKLDFIKVDTDGHDIEVVLGTEQMLSAGHVLGFSIEAQFHGAPHDSANTFANIDRFMRGHGFTLFDLDVFRYSRAALPAPFIYDIPAQTTSGQVLWGEAVYFRDIGDAEYEQKWPFEMTRERIVKLACLFALFGVPDCAAEMLTVRGDFLDAATRQELLDTLTPPEGPGMPERPSYADYVGRFERDVKSFYPSSKRVPESRPAAPASAAAAKAEKARVANASDAAEEYLAELRARLAELKAR
jgi:hypothetical protein